MCVFSKKKSEKKPQEGFIDCSEIDIFIALFVFSHIAFLSFAPSCIFSLELFWVALKVFPGPFVFRSEGIQGAD